MTENIKPRYVNTNDAAKFLRVDPKVLIALRRRKVGIGYHKLGHTRQAMVRYDLEYLRQLRESGYLQTIFRNVTISHT